MSNAGYCLVSQEIRNGLIVPGFLQVPEGNIGLADRDSFDGERLLRKKGWFNDDGLEKRVQAGSYETSLADELFVLDAQGQGILRPRRDETIYRTLLQIPARKRARKSIVGGFEVKTGFTYLVKLEERFSAQNPLVQSVTSVRSSSKSSMGRLFSFGRFMADYNPSFDEVYFFDKDMDMWLLLQPTKFNMIVHPGLTVNQLRFFCGDAKLTDTELAEEFVKNPLLYRKKEVGEQIQMELSPGMISDGLRLSVDARGLNTHGVFGLRARNNPDPIDLSKKGFYSAEDYFEPVVSGKRNVFARDGSYLLNSNEVLHVPKHLSAELKKHSREGIEGRTHEAGFADQPFVGDMVFEVIPDEREDMPIEHGMPLSALEFHRTNAIADKLYGEESGSHYQGQIGPRVSKHFKAFDFENAARNHEKLSRIVLVEDANTLRSFRHFSEGFEPIREDDAKKLIGALRNGFFHSRYDCEEDELVLQGIPYTIVFNKKGEVFSYVRTDNPKDFGDARLLGKHSIGLGGHVNKTDGPNYIERCLEREVTIEEAKFLGDIGEPKLVGTLFARDKPVDRVHFGLIYTLFTDGEAVSNEPSITHTEFVPLDKMVSGFRGYETETWSKILIPHLESLYALSNRA